MPHAVSIGLVSVLALVLNAPLGYWRKGCRKYSAAWFVAIHASVPFVIAARLLLGVSWLWIPLFLALAVAGQILGGRFRRTTGRDSSSDRTARQGVPPRENRPGGRANAADPPRRR